MFYLIKSNTKYISEKIIDKVISSKDIEKENVYFFDYEEKNDFENAFLEYLSINFDNKPKAIILKNANFLNISKPIKEHISKFENSIKSNSRNIILFIVDKINKTGKLIKKYKENFEILEKDSPDSKELIFFVEDFFKNKNIKLEKGGSKKIVDMVGNQFDLIISELKKLETLSNDNFISNEIIEKTILDFSRERPFYLASKVLTLDISGISYMIEKYRIQGEPLFLVSEKLSLEFGRVLRYKILCERKGTKISENELYEMTKWNIWGIKNYHNWSRYWESIEEMSNFFYDIILNKCFFELLESKYNDPLKLLEKILINNILKIKNKIKKA